MKKAKIFFDHPHLTGVQIRAKVAVHMDPSLLINFTLIGSQLNLVNQQPGIVGGYPDTVYAYELVFSDDASDAAIQSLSEL